MQKLFSNFLKFLSRLSGKHVVYFNTEAGAGKSLTAVRSSEGFWYAGNVLNPEDIAYGILNNGRVEAEETELVVKLVGQLLQQKSNINFYDIGANTGYYGILSAYLGKGKVQAFSFEPLEENYKYLNEAVYLNRLENNLKLFPLALGNQNGEQEIFGGGTGASLNKEFLNSPGAKGFKVQVKKLDDLITEQSLPLPDFIKIDTEGHELAVLEGASETLKKSLPILFVEIALSLKSIGRNYVNKNYARTFDFLSQLGYEAYCLENGRLIKTSKEILTEGVKMFLFAHSEKSPSLTL